MSDVFREVDDEVRRERASEFWKRYGTIVIVVAALIVVGIGGWRLYDYWQDQRAAAFGDRYAAAIALAEAGDDDGARAAFAALAADSAGGYPVLARLAAAAEQAKAGDVEGAAAAYRAVAAEADGPMADIARLRAAYLMVGRDSTDAVMAVLGRTVDQNNAFYLSAQEVLGLEAWSREDMAVAETHFLAVLSAPNPPQGLRSRAEIMLDLIAGSGGTPPNVAPLPAAPAPSAFETPTLTAPQIAPQAAPVTAPQGAELPLGAARPAPVTTTTTTPDAATPGTTTTTTTVPVATTPATPSDEPTGPETPQ